MCVCVCREGWGTDASCPLSVCCLCPPVTILLMRNKAGDDNEVSPAGNKTKLKGLNMTVNLTSSSLQCLSYEGTVLKQLFNSHYSLLIWCREAQTDSRKRLRERDDITCSLVTIVTVLWDFWVTRFIAHSWFSVVLTEAEQWNIYIKGQGAVWTD